MSETLLSRQVADTAADEFDPFAAGVIEQVVPTTEAQREVWLGDRLSPQASLAYNESLRLQFKGALDTRALAQALDRLVARHQSLRSTISPDGTQLLIGEAAPFELARHDLQMLAPAERQLRLDDDALAAVLEPFQLEKGPLFRAALYQLSADDQVLLLTAHHAVCDGWSWGILSHDLGLLYAEQVGAGPALEPAARYADYAAWEAAQAAGPEMQGHVDYWLSRFAGSSLPVLELPQDHPRPAVRTFNSRRIDRVLDQTLIDALRKTGGASGVSLFATMFSAFASTLHRLTAQDDLVVGIAAAGQMPSGMTSLVGHCVNLLPIRVAVDSQMPFDGLMRQSASHLLDAFEHQTLTYGSLLKKLPVPRDPSRLPLVNVLFNVDPNAAPDGGNFPDLEVAQSTIGRRFENFELFLNIIPVPGGMQMEAQYNADLYDDASVRRWLDMYGCLLRSVTLDPTQPVGKLDVLSDAEAGHLVALQPAATPLHGQALMHAGFVERAALAAERPALNDGSRRWSYRELDEQSNRLAHALRERGVARGQRVGLCLERNADMMVALLAVLKAGAAYVPLDPGFPKARLDYYAEDAALSLLLTGSDVTVAPTSWCADAARRVFALDRETAWLDQPSTALAPSPQDALPEDAAYVIYTSGSTGKPKGVCVPHRAVANFLQSMREVPGISADDRLAAVTTLSFDIAVLELMLPLTAGAEVILVPRETTMDGEALRKLVEDSGATMMQATPSGWRLLLDAQWRGTPAFKALVGGEGLPPDLAQSLLQRCGELWNMYGPTETTIWSTLWRVDPVQVAQRGVSIGQPIANTTVWILDSNGQRCPIGVPGEIVIGGVGVTLGYLERPELTAERFVPDPWGSPGATLYRTGDRGRWRNDGLLEHMGRFDFQVKVRGYRIELGEIEARCNEAPGVASSVVLAREDRPGDVRLVAYLAMTPGAVYDRSALRELLHSRLPQYMVPQHVVVLPALPLLPNGKIDRKALPEPNAAAAASEAKADAAARVAPRNDGEKAVLAAMEEVLHLPAMSVLDDFFAVGGHSLLAAHLTTRINAHFGIRLPLSKLFEAPTAEQLARAIELAQVDKRTPIVIPRRTDRSRAPLTLEQQRMRFAQELHPESAPFNTPSAHRLTGPMDRAKFEQALREVVRRQDAMRTAIVQAPDGDGWIQRIEDRVRFDIPFEDLRSIPGEEREAELMRRMKAIIAVPIPAAPAPLFRCALYRLGEQEHAFLFMVHHLVWDGYSFDILYRELAAAYVAQLSGSANPMPELSLRYGDYTQWHLQWLEGPEAATQQAYWQKRLALAPLLAHVPADMQAQPGAAGVGKYELLALDTGLQERLRTVATQHHLTLNMLVMASFAVMLSNAIGKPEVSVGMPVRGRMLPELDHAAGFFVGLVPVYGMADKGLRFVDFAASLKQEVVAALDHQDLPYEYIHQQASPDQRRTGLYQAVFSFQDTRERMTHWGPLAHDMIPVVKTGVTDNLGLWMLDRQNGLQGRLIYNANVYTREKIVSLHEQLIDILRAVAERPHATLSELGSGAIAAQPLRIPEAPAPTSLLQPEQARLAQIWASAIGIDVNEIRSTDTFFDLGGDSLLTMRVIQQAQQALGFRVEPRRYVFETLAQLAVPPVESEIDVAAGAAQAELASKRGGLLGRVFSGWGRKA
ncbi:non-ribosomal peptide synthetase [Variovorax saccharolyticus]|uniref:non-ribosomal peptide synthetase n=1 Tax=Variovorax saccharolyticus TaxID=3053516 RepID=UPI002575A632|nr:non-ribosomal peptide synthetase [Variovorax sp. J22R187]MDM0017772.1 amino acid adenylation domain-containing protein [Variovorax sp. J22R187]